MNLDIQSLFPDLEALTPDGRWSMLQDWLSKNPKYAERAERWAKEPVDTVFAEIRNLAMDEYGVMVSFFLNSPSIKMKALSAITVLQACYRERAGNQSEKEIKNVRIRRSTKRRSTKNH